jgi:sucrose phosphorylase
MNKTKDSIQQYLAELYGAQTVPAIWPKLEAILQDFQQRNPALAKQSPHDRVTEQDALLITYADQFQQDGQAHLRTLLDFLEAHLGDIISGVHLLPFFPYSSDDGFSVIDYRQIAAGSGTWTDVAALGQRYRLMFDAVINHISRHSDWFQQYKKDIPPFNQFFLEIDPSVDLSMVTRPRALPLLTEVETEGGTRFVWTTFSEDQIDLNYSNPEVLLEIIRVLLFYVEKGAEFIRLDAIGYLWKEVGTASIHLPQTHTVIKIWREILDAVAPRVILITETNVPHAENISYFGNGFDEAQMVYQFPLAPLVLDAFLTGKTHRLSNWAANLENPSSQATFFNFIASHDGIGVRPAEGILSPEQIQLLADRTIEHGGRISYKNNPDGSKSVYELNITLYDFLNDPNNPNPEIDVTRFLASQAIMLALAGVPGIYVHSLFGSGNCLDCMLRDGHARAINREKFNRQKLEARLSGGGTHLASLFSSYRNLIKVRSQQPAFHPNAPQRILQLHDSVFAVERVSLAGDQTVICLANLSSHQIELTLGTRQAQPWHDLIPAEPGTSRNGGSQISLQPYQARWLSSGETR